MLVLQVVRDILFHLVVQVLHSLLLSRVIHYDHLIRYVQVFHVAQGVLLDLLVLHHQLIPKNLEE